MGNAQDYIKGKWMDTLDDFFNEARRDTEYDGMCNGEPMIPRTTKEMINVVLEDDRTDFFGCEECSDSTNGARSVNCVCHTVEMNLRCRIMVKG